MNQFWAVFLISFLGIMLGEGLWHLAMLAVLTLKKRALRVRENRFVVAEDGHVFLNGKELGEKPAYTRR